MYELEITVKARTFRALMRLLYEASESLARGHMWKKSSTDNGEMCMSVAGMNEDDFRHGWETWKS